MLQTYTARRVHHELITVCMSCARDEGGPLGIGYHELISKGGCVREVRCYDFGRAVGSLTSIPIWCYSSHETERTSRN